MKRTTMWIALMTILFAPALTAPAALAQEHGEHHEKMHGEGHDQMHGQEHGQEHGQMHGDGHGAMHGDAHGAAMMPEAVKHYAAISEVLAADSVKGIPAHAQALLDLVASHEKDAGEDMHSGEAASAHAEVKASLTTLASEDLDLEGAREAFTTLSAAFVPMARMHYDGRDADTTYAVMHCPMAPGTGDWIQADGKLANPYYGSQMLRCGKKLGTLGATASKGESGTHGEGHGDHQSHGAHEGHGKGMHHEGHGR